MRRLAALTALFLASLLMSDPAAARPQWALVVHGGAGVIARSDLTPEQERAYRAALTRVTEAGGAVLARGGSAVDAVETAIKLLEDDPLFNAGRGAVFTSAGENEMDAAVMDGRDRRAGAVGSLVGIRHPVAAARA